MPLKHSEETRQGEQKEPLAFDTRGMFFFCKSTAISCLALSAFLLFSLQDDIPLFFPAEFATLGIFTYGAGWLVRFFLTKNKGLL